MRGFSESASAARSRIANDSQCRQTLAFQNRVVTLVARNRRFTVDLSGGCSPHSKSQFLSNKPMIRLHDLVADLTVPCTDNGHRFTQNARLLRIQSALKESGYRLFGEMPLAYVYCQKEYSVEKPTILISTHIDSLYIEYFTNLGENEIVGTFDNSATNAVAVYLMINNRLPPQVLVAFTGDEENQSVGADQTIQILQNKGPSFRNLELVITLDITEESFGKSHFTIENYFVNKQNGDSLLKFTRQRELKKYIMEILDRPVVIKNAEPDESWKYDEYDLNCLTLCLPCRLLGADMHEDCGVAILTESFDAYATSLERITERVCNDLANKAVDSTRNRP